MNDFHPANPYPVHRGPLLARNVVATSQPLAAQAGLRMLLKGGNAVDAALASAIALTVVEPTANGVGSDAFAIVWDGSALHGLNGSGRAPAGWTPQRFAGLKEMPARGWESVTVPGAVAAWVTLSERFGKLPFAALFEPAIDYAANGFPVSPLIAGLWRQGAGLLARQPGFADHFIPQGRTPAAGEVFVNLDLARSLEAIADSRGEAFYRGALAEKIVAFGTANGAVLSRDDLAAHRSEWCGTIATPFQGIEAHEIPPNGQGIAALIAFGILENTELASLGVDSAAAAHLQIEAVKLAYADADRYVADPDFMEVTAAALLDPAYLKQRAKLIDRKRAGDPGAGAPTAGGTVYVSTADAGGMVVSYIQSNYFGFGSGVVVPGTGIHLQNRGISFTLAPGHANLVGPRKRPFHTIIPGFLMKGGRPLMSYGIMGGSMQAQGHVQLAVRTQVFGQHPQAASDAPRWRFVAGREVALEAGTPDPVANGLAALGHQVRRESPDETFAFGGAQLVQRLENGVYVAGSDHRKDGQAVGL